MEFVDVLVGRRLQRELRRREAELREADGRAAPIEQEYEATIVPRAEPKLESLVVQHTYLAKAAFSPESRAIARGRWHCDFCGRGFHSYGQFLNHKCQEPG